MIHRERRRSDGGRLRPGGGGRQQSEADDKGDDAEGQQARGNAPATFVRIGAVKYQPPKCMYKLCLTQILAFLFRKDCAARITNYDANLQTRNAEIDWICEIVSSNGVLNDADAGPGD